MSRIQLDQGHVKGKTEPSRITDITTPGLCPSLLGCWGQKIPTLGVNTMPADELAPEVASASAGMVLALLFQTEFQLLGSRPIQDTIQNVNISFIIL